MSEEIALEILEMVRFIKWVVGLSPVIIIFFIVLYIRKLVKIESTLNEIYRYLMEEYIKENP